MTKLLVALVFAFCLKGTDTDVFICKSKTAYAYHNDKSCRGLNNCTHTIAKVSLTEAKKQGKKKPCGYCYGR